MEASEAREKREHEYRMQKLKSSKANGKKTSSPRMNERINIKGMTQQKDLWSTVRLPCLGPFQALFSRWTKQGKKIDGKW